jgi:hypothetical protein
MALIITGALTRCRRTLASQAVDAEGRGRALSRLLSSGGGGEGLRRCIAAFGHGRIARLAAIKDPRTMAAGLCLPRLGLIATCCTTPVSDCPCVSMPSDRLAPGPSRSHSPRCTPAPSLAATRPDVDAPVPLFNLIKVETLPLPRMFSVFEHSILSCSRVVRRNGKGTDVCCVPARRCVGNYSQSEQRPLAYVTISQPRYVRAKTG